MHITGHGFSVTRFFVLNAIHSFKNKDKRHPDPQHFPKDNESGLNHPGLKKQKKKDSWTRLIASLH